MEKCHSKEGHRDPSCNGFGSISLGFSLLCLVLSVNFFLWLDITFDHICAWLCERKRRKNSSESSPRKMNDWPSIPPLPRSVIENIIDPQLIMCPFLNQSLARRKTRLLIVQLGLSKVLVVELAHPLEQEIYRRYGPNGVLFGRRSRE